MNKLYYIVGLAINDGGLAVKGNCVISLGYYKLLQKSYPVHYAILYCIN